MKQWKTVMETIKKRLLDIDEAVVVAGPTASLLPKVCLVLGTRPMAY